MQTVLIPLSFGALGKNNGTELAPKAIANGLKLKAESAKIDNLDIEKSHANIEKTAHDCLKQKCFFLGGDHSLTYSTFRAFSRRFGKKNAVLVLLDAHADCTYFTSIKSHEDYVRALVEEGFLQPQNILMLGTRHVWKNEKEFLKKKKIKTISAKEIKKSLKKTSELLHKFLVGKKAVYVSIDFDVLDAKFAFATGYPEANGLNEKELFALLKVALQAHVRAVDFVEYNPLLDKQGKGQKTAEKIVRFVLRFGDCQ